MSLNLAIFGVTGSIGSSALEVLKSNPNCYKLSVISGHNNIARLAQIAEQWQPDKIILTNRSKYHNLLERLNNFQGEVLCGIDYLDEVAIDHNIDAVLAAISGSSGISSCYKALSYGKKLLLANKEALVAAGDLMMEAASKGGGQILPVDSEHSGLWQCLGSPFIPLERKPKVKRMILTASGGPFRDWSIDDIASASVEEACNHPNWSMGRKISVDSASMMNKGLELIEASYLFKVDMSALDVVIHRQSIVHAMIEYRDGSILSQMSGTSMQVSLSKALGFPGLCANNIKGLKLDEISGLTFEHLDIDKYPCLPLAIEALEHGGDAPLRLNAANEVAVEAFLENKINFGDIYSVIASVLETSSHNSFLDIDSVLQADVEAKREARDIVNREISL